MEKKLWPDLKIIFPVVLIILGVLTHNQIPIYNDKETLWLDTIKNNPDSWMAHNNLGSHLVEKGKIEGAINNYRIAIKIKPEYALAHTNLGSLLYVRGKIDEQFEREIVTGIMLHRENISCR